MQKICDRGIGFVAEVYLLFQRVGIVVDTFATKASVMIFINRSYMEIERTVSTRNGNHDRELIVETVCFIITFVLKLFLGGAGT